MVGFSYGHQPVKIPPQTRLNMCKLESCRLPIADDRAKWDIDLIHPSGGSGVLVDLC